MIPHPYAKEPHPATQKRNAEDIQIYRAPPGKLFHLHSAPLSLSLFYLSVFHPTGVEVVCGRGRGRFIVRSGVAHGPTPPRGRARVEAAGVKAPFELARLAFRREEFRRGREEGLKGSAPRGERVESGGSIGWPIDAAEEYSTLDFVTRLMYRRGQGTGRVHGWLDGGNHARTSPPPPSFDVQLTNSPRPSICGNLPSRKPIFPVPALFTRTSVRVSEDLVEDS